MDSKKLRNLSRQDLLELLLEQVRENEVLIEENKGLKNELKRREVIAKEKGSLAEACLEIVGIFEKADEAAQIYLDNLKNLEDVDL